MIGGQKKWMESGGYLPRPLRDFHDQKDAFKAIHEIVSGNDGTKQITWVQAHIYVIDVFLWFMALRGYTLQKSRMKFDFADFEKTVAEQKSKRDDAFYAALKGQSKGVPP